MTNPQIASLTTELCIWLDEAIRRTEGDDKSFMNHTAAHTFRLIRSELLRTASTANNLNS